MGARKEYLTRVISHPQALAQCELTLTKLGLNVAREAVNDTAGAAEFFATNNLRDSQRTCCRFLRDEHTCRWNPGRLKQRDPVRHAGPRAHNTSHQLSIQDEQCVRP
ncbi:hypothetical protein SO802_005191 [Lithocarpus litseifolius]|uniref:Prephenate dehydratase domain-containing protein n=1 Tax=Lithocarpus litseifolius TaxID=425828 RepID=A0AAW2DHH7_9ROSI